MEIKVLRFNDLIEVIVKIDGTGIETGFMTEKEAQKMACEFIEAAAEILNSLP